MFTGWQKEQVTGNNGKCKDNANIVEGTASQ